jgi:hypothetical protein
LPPRVDQKRFKLGVKLTVENLKSGIQKHPDRSLQIPWNFAQVGVLIFPVIPILGALGIFLGLIGTYKQKNSEILRCKINRYLNSQWLVIISGNFYPV